MRTKKVKSTGRFGPRYGSVVKEKIKLVEAKQRQKQRCPFCKKYNLKRVAAGLWFCKICKKRFASQAYIHKSI